MTRQARTLLDVVKLMDEWFYDFIGESEETIGANGKKRTVLLFENRYRREDTDINKQYLIGNNFKVDKYNHGRYYKIYRCI